MVITVLSLGSTNYRYCSSPICIISHHYVATSSCSQTRLGRSLNSMLHVNASDYIDDDFGDDYYSDDDATGTPVKLHGKLMNV